MGQSPSSTSRHDNASTRTLHSTSIHSSRPPTFFQRLSHKLHKPRRFQKRRRARRQQQQQQQPATTSSVTHNTAITAPSTTSSVRYETQEAARAAAAVTGPSLLYHLQSQPTSSDNASGGTVSFQDNSNTIEPVVNPQGAITHTEQEETQEQLQEIAQQQDHHHHHQDGNQEQQPQSRRRSSSNNSNNISIISLFQLPSFLNSQENGDDNESLEGGSSSGSSNASLPGLLSLILLSYFGQLTNDMPGTSFITIQRPQSEHSSSSTETMRSIPFSLTTASSSSHQPNNTTTNTNDNNENSGSGSGSDSSTNSSNENNNNNNDDDNLSSGGINNNDTTSNRRRRTERSVILILHGPGSSSLSDNPTYEELLMLGTMLGQVRPDTTTQAAVDEAIPVTFWSEATKKELIGTDQCLVCLDEFAIAQPVRILKCRHVFHRECVDRWLCESHNSCPVCRRVPVETNDN